MPKLSVWMVRCALLYLGIGFSLGALMLLNKGTNFAPEMWRFLPMHIEFLLVGWSAQLAAGVAFWILPRLSGGKERGDTRPAWVGWLLLNAGIFAVSLSSVFGWLPALILIGRIAEVLAALMFALHFWPRVKAFGT
jgi:hypothetical protein